MTSSLRYAAVALCAALAFTACTKSSQTSTTTDATQTAAPDTTQGAGSTAAPDATATDAGAAPSATTPASTAPGTTTTNGSSGASTGYIDLPVYPGSTESKGQELSMSSNGNSVVIKVYATNDDAGKVTNWYKSNLPAAWKNAILSSDGKTTGTFSNELSDGDQSVIVTTQDTNTRIQLATKHGK